MPQQDFPVQKDLPVGAPPEEGAECCALRQAPHGVQDREASRAVVLHPRYDHDSVHHVCFLFGVLREQKPEVLT